MKKELKQKNFIPKPEYPGGSKAMNAFIQSQLKYPKTAFDQKTEGTVVIKAEINFRGEVINTKVISSLGNGCDEEASRVIHLLKFNVDKVRNLKIIFFKTFNIHFKMPTAAPNQTVGYVYVSTSVKVKLESPTVEKTNYNYVIKYN